MSDQTVQYRRYCEVVAGVGGTGTLIKGPTTSEPGFRIQFEITKDIHREPNAGQIRIYNLSPDNETKLRTEYKDVLVNAGYVGNVLLIFRGNIRHAFRYRDGNDWVSQIDAGDGDLDFRTSIVNRTLAAGSSDKDLLDAAVSSFRSTTLGHAPIQSRTRGRARVVSGMSRDVVESLAVANGAHWSIQDGVLQIVPVDSTLPTEAIVLNSQTGLLGSPEISDKGIKVTCLLNPRIHINGKVQLDNNDLKELIRKQKHQQPGAPKKSTAPVRLDPDGTYKVFKHVMRGDTRSADSNSWISEVHCVGLGQPIPSAQGAVP